MENVGRVNKILCNWIKIFTLWLVLNIIVRVLPSLQSSISWGDSITHWSGVTLSTASVSIDIRHKQALIYFNVKLLKEIEFVIQQQRWVVPLNVLKSSFSNLSLTSRMSNGPGLDLYLSLTIIPLSNISSISRGSGLCARRLPGPGSGRHLSLGLSDDSLRVWG